MIVQDRRRIESEFFTGNLLGVAATNALELGIDVGHIDVTLHLGFPGNISRYLTWFICVLDTHLFWTVIFPCPFLIAAVFPDN